MRIYTAEIGEIFEVSIVIIPVSAVVLQYCTRHYLLLLCVVLYSTVQYSTAQYCIERRVEDLLVQARGLILQYTAAG